MTISQTIAIATIIAIYAMLFRNIATVRGVATLTLAKQVVTSPLTYMAIASITCAFVAAVGLYVALFETLGHIPNP